MSVSNSAWRKKKFPVLVQVLNFLIMLYRKMVGNISILTHQTG